MKNHISMQICAIKYRKIKSFDSYSKYQSGTLTEITVNIYFRDLWRNNIQYWVITGRIFVAIYLLTNVLPFSYTWFSPCPNHKSCFLIFLKLKCNTFSNWRSLCNSYLYPRYRTGLKSNCFLLLLRVSIKNFSFPVLVNKEDYGCRKGRSGVCSLVITAPCVIEKTPYVITCLKSLLLIKENLTFQHNRISLALTMIVQSHKFDWFLKVFLYLHL